MTPERLEEIAVELLEAHDWEVRKVLRTVKRALWLALMRRVNWSVVAASKVARVRRVDMYRYLKVAGVELKRE